MKRVIIFISLLFLFPALTQAGSIVVTEIMYDVPGTDSGREWIEVHNIGTSTADLSSWKLFEANTNHKITPVSSSTMAAGTYGIIADDPIKFKVDYPSYNGPLF